MKNMVITIRYYHTHKTKSTKNVKNMKNIRELLTLKNDFTCYVYYPKMLS